MFLLKNIVIKSLLTVIFLLILALIPQTNALSSSSQNLIQKPAITAYCDRWFYWHRWRQHHWWGGQLYSNDWKYTNNYKASYHIEF